MEIKHFQVKINLTHLCKIYLYFSVKSCIIALDMKNYDYNPNDSDSFYYHIRFLATDKDFNPNLSEMDLERVEENFELYEFYVKRMLEKCLTKNGVYEALFNAKGNKKHDFNCILQQDIRDEIETNGNVFYNISERTYNAGPRPYDCYGPWEDRIIEYEVYEFDDWDPCDLHEYLENFRNMSRRERYNFMKEIIDYAIKRRRK